MSATDRLPSHAGSELCKDQSQSRDPLLGARLQRAPSVSVRPERFGALLYDFRTRQLLFLKTPRLAEIIGCMDGSTSVEQCLDESGSALEEHPALLAVIRHLLSNGMVRHHPHPEDPQ
ncbi:MAG: mycofactocin biosynthesis chaperone MftB [Micrococcaceae bacterium]